MGASRQQRPTEGSEAASQIILSILLILSQRVFAVPCSEFRQPCPGFVKKEDVRPLPATPRPH